MPKMKSVKGAVKRFKKTKSGIKRGSAFRSHILTKKSPKTKRGLKASKYVNSANIKNVTTMLGTGI